MSGEGVKMSVVDPSLCCVPDLFCIQNGHNFLTVRFVVFVFKCASTLSDSGGSIDRVCHITNQVKTCCCNLYTIGCQVGTLTLDVRLELSVAIFKHYITFMVITVTSRDIHKSLILLEFRHDSSQHTLNFCCSN
eukprot:Lithocolla_globosa_v1_NODE_240_length_4926_cov_5.703552.p2 type:complete len:134 gc:universal NODE_240_length_4926_cov_5.703552:2536-2135(-)